MSAAPDKSYWRRHLREAVRFGDGMLALAKLECQTFWKSDHTRSCYRLRKSVLAQKANP